MHSFAPDLAASLGGPDWLRAKRAAQAERFGSMSLPSDAEEVWRYSRIGELDLEAYRPPTATAPAAASTTTPAEIARLTDLVGACAAQVVIVDGQVVRTDVEDKTVHIGEPDERTFGAAAGDPTEAFTTLNVAFTSSPVQISIEPGAIVEHPILVFHVLTQPHTAQFPRTIVALGDDAQATVLEHHSSTREANALTVPVTELVVGRAARLKYLHVQALDATTWQIAHQASAVDRDGHLQSMAVALGGDYARTRTDSRLVGQGASSELLAVYFGEGTQMHDFRTLQAHEAPSTNSELLFKGAVEDHARGVYSGLIRIDKGAQKSNAFQTNRNLILSEGAHADSIPNLEIEANDVRCSHATAVGPIDEEQLYYVESRGLPPEAAERLIVLGFFGEVLARIPIKTLERELRDQVAEKLQRRSET